MKADAKMERQISHLNEQDFKKLFPEQYFSKYAAHQRILSFEQQLFSETKIQNSPPLPKSLSQPQLLATPATVKITRFDQPLDVIAKNKQETVRMEGFVKELNSKLKGGAVRSNSQIRAPLTGFQAIPEGVFTRLKLIEDAQYEAEMAYERERKRKAGLHMNFVTRSRNHSISESKLSMRFDRSVIAQSAQSKQLKEVEGSRAMRGPQKIVHSGQHLRSMSYGERVSKMVEKAKSQIAVLDPEKEKDGVRYILAMNRSIRKINGLKEEMAGERRKVLGWARSDKRLKTLNSASSGTDKLKKRRNLIEITDNVRRQGEAIEVLSHYETALANRTLRLRLADGVRY